MIHQTTRRTDDDLRAGIEAAELALVTLATVNGQLAETAFEKRQFRHFFCDLDRQFARRQQNQNLYGAALYVDFVDSGNGERGGLAGAGRGLTDHIAPSENRRNYRGLNGRCFLKAHFFHGFE